MDGIQQVPMEQERAASNESQEELPNGILLEDDIGRVSSESALTTNSAVPNLSAKPGYSFKHWINSIRANRVAASNQSRYVAGWPEDDAMDESCDKFPEFQPGSFPDNSSIASSFLHRVVESASLSQVSLGHLTRPRTDTQTSSHGHSSAFSGSDTRKSTESNRLTSAMSVDEGAWNRAVQRRQIIRELIETETVYVSGLKALGDILSTMFVSRTGIHRSVGELTRLHSSFLAALKNSVSRSDTMGSLSGLNWMPGRRKVKKSIIDVHLTKPDRKSVTTRKLREPIEYRIKSSKLIAAEPSEAGEVAKILMSKLHKFNAYQDYGVKYHLVSQEVEDLKKTVNFNVWDQGAEALSRSVAPLACQEISANQALTINDLLARPIQRVCKYQLFLFDLLKCTPVSDCPGARATLERVHQRMIDVVQEINRATGDPIAKDRMEKTLRLQAMIDFRSKLALESDILRDFGPIVASGVLHVAYETPSVVAGEYMMCVLFGCHIVLATPSTEHHKFSAVAIIQLLGSILDGPNNGIGLKCDGMLHSWKLIYRDGDRAFELVMTACSGKEATKWKDQLVSHMAVGGTAAASRMVTTVHLPVKPLPTLEDDEASCDIGHTILRIKGTEAFPKFNQASNTPLSRSQSMKSLSSMATLSPKRQDRMRMERMLSNVWTVDVIPYPGMPGRGEDFIRSSAGSFIRSLSNRRPFVRRPTILTSTNSQKSIDFSSPRKGNAMVDEMTEKGMGEFEDKMDFSDGSLNSSPVQTPISTVRSAHSTFPKTNDVGEEKPEFKQQQRRKKWSVSLFKGPQPAKTRCSWPFEA
ncbi:hypothetical protein FQN57_006652 [Myotisia sp. PD_48]|nr:hypothetical protein FQN57_006652 [Myotisia sp. PD_48]